MKANRQDANIEEYVLVEDVNKSWDKCESEKSVQRMLDMNESILQAQSKWKGSGKFVLRKQGNVS